MSTHKDPTSDPEGAVTSNITMCPECGNAFHDHCFDCSYRPIQGLELSLEELCVVGEMAYKKDLTPAQLFKQALRFYQMNHDRSAIQVPAAPPLPSVTETAKACYNAAQYRQGISPLHEIESILCHFLGACEHELRELRAECERLSKDKERLDWVMEFITQKGGDGIAKLIWSQVDPEEIMEDRIDLTFDRVAIDAAMQPSETRERAMTTDQILAQCDTIRELSEKATADPWERGIGGRIRSHGHTVIPEGNIVSDRDEEDTDFIVSSRTFAPSAAQALRVAIEALESAAKVFDVYKELHSNKVPPAWEKANSNAEEAQKIREALQQITEAFK